MIGAAIALPISGFVGCVLTAGLSDARTLRIPNSLTLIILGLFGVYALVALTPSAASTALALSGVTLVAGYLLYACGLLGAGDAKLLAACMAWAGPANAFLFLTVTGLVGGALAIALMSPSTVRTTAVLQRGWPAPAPDSRGRPARARMPYGVAISAGALAVAGRLLAS